MAGPQFIGIEYIYVVFCHDFKYFKIVIPGLPFKLWVKLSLHRITTDQKANFRMM